MITISCVLPVSYTHLDVYKRQQEQQIAGLEATQREVDEFINLTVDRDNSASSEISRAKKDFYKQYSYLKPDCEKTTGKSSAKA